MSSPSSAQLPYFSEKDQLLKDISHAFRDVTLICNELINKINKGHRNVDEVNVELQPKKSVSPPSKPLDFNNYKGNRQNKSNKVSQQQKGANQPKNNVWQMINAFNVDGDSDQESKAPRSKPSQHNQGIKKLRPSITPTHPQISSKEQKTKTHKGMSSKSVSNSTNNIPKPPKAPLSPYFIFYNEKKGLIMSEFPEMSVTELTSAAAKVWKSLTEKEKEPFNEKFFREKEKYEKEIKEYAKKYPNYKELGRGQGESRGGK